MRKRTGPTQPTVNLLNPSTRPTVTSSIIGQIITTVARRPGKLLPLPVHLGTPASATAPLHDSTYASHYLSPCLPLPLSPTARHVSGADPEPEAEADSEPPRPQRRFPQKPPFLLRFAPPPSRRAAAPSAAVLAGSGVRTSAPRRTPSPGYPASARDDGAPARLEPSAFLGLPCPRDPPALAEMAAGGGDPLTPTSGESPLTPLSTLLASDRVAEGFPVRLRFLLFGEMSF